MRVFARRRALGAIFAGSGEPALKGNAIAHDFSPVLQPSSRRRQGQSGDAVEAPCEGSQERKQKREVQEGRQNAAGETEGGSSDVELDRTQLQEALRMRLAATDLFVEKAQLFLTQRARRLTYIGICCGAMGLISTWFSILLMVSLPLPLTIDTGVAIVLVVRATAIGRFAAAVSALFFYMSRTLFHEATVLYNRRHHLRFGRLYVYLSGDPVTADELARAFEWSGDYGSAFLRIKHLTPQGLAGLLDRSMETVGKVAERSGKAAP